VPEGAYRFGKEGLKKENGDIASAWDRRGDRIASPQKHDMKDDFVIAWILRVPVELPIAQCSMDFHIAVVGCSVDSNNCVAKVGTSVSIERACFKYTYNLLLRGFECEAVEVLTAPDVTEEPFMNIEREFTHRKR
jgi:hypothetical protein